MEILRLVLLVFYFVITVNGFKGKVGTRPTDMELFSYKASVHVNQKTKDVRICSGAIVDAIHVLTTAACFYSYLEKDYTASIRVGSLLAHTGGRVHAIKKGPILHPHFDVETHRHNVAIITIQEYAMEFSSTVNKIPINYDYMNGCNDVTIVAFGEPFTSQSTPAKEMYTTTSITMDIFQCGEALQNTIAAKNYYEETLCIKPSNKVELCSSDEGALVIYKNQLVGILSQFPGGLGCSGNLPYLFTRIGHYHSWMNTHLNPHLFGIVL